MATYGPGGAQYLASVLNTETGEEWQIPGEGSAGYWNRNSSSTSGAGVYIEAVRDPRCCELWRQFKEGRDELIIYRDSEEVWCGPIELKRRTPDGIGFLAARDRTWWIDQRWPYSRIEESDSGLLVLALLQAAGAVDPIDLVPIASPSGRSVEIDVEPFRKMSSALRQASVSAHWTAVCDQLYIGKAALPNATVGVSETNWIGGGPGIERRVPPSQVLVRGWGGSSALVPEDVVPGECGLVQVEVAYPSSNELILATYGKSILDRTYTRISTESLSLSNGDFEVCDLIPGREVELDINDGCEEVQETMELSQVSARWADEVEDFFGISVLGVTERG